METNILKWNFPNWLTVLLMVWIGYAVAGVAFTYVNQRLTT